MENFLFSFNVVAPLFVLIIAGYLLRRINFLSATFLSEANEFVFRLLLPLMLFQNIRNTFHGDFSNPRLMFSALIGVAVVIVVATFFVCLLVKRKGQRGSMIQAIYRSNFLIYGLPLVTGIHGQEALNATSLIMGVIIPFYNIMAVVILSIFSETRVGSLSVKKLFIDIFKNPLLLGCVAGILFGVLMIPMPEFINRSIMDLAMPSSALALFIMGGEFKAGSLRKNIWKSLSATAARIIIVPLVAMIVFVNIGFRGLDLSILLCLFATPTAVSSYIMAQNMGNDGDIAAQVVVLTTLGSSVTIFVFILVLKNMMLI
ncbi:MAG: AEC family transporter [Prevotellaceae bacterium]|jgi:predicted permease|nr:AEC family transporter [Prevotellaceae bacterium]